MTVEPIVSERPDGPGIRAFDPIEKSYEDLHTPAPVAPTPTGTDAFHFPVDLAVAVQTDRVRTPYRIDVWIRDLDGDLLADTSSPGEASVPAGSYNVELSVTGVKIYLAVESAVTVTQHDDATEIRFGDESRVAVGVRSYHEQPAGTVTVTDDPADLMRGLSLFGSALKTTSPERTFPTLRGHPPTLERGERFEAPGDLAAPDTGVVVEVPPERESVFQVTSLAYFLGAAVRPGAEPRLLVGDRSYPLDGPGGFADGVRRLLEQTFLFDCVTRTEGLYTVRLDERERVEAALDREFDFAALYDRPLAERVNRYLEVPYERIADVVPTWPLTADVEPTPENAAVLPFVADKLGVVRCDTDGPTLEMESQPVAVGDFYRQPGRDGGGDEGDRDGREGGDGAGRPARADGGALARRDGAFAEPLEVVRPPETDALEHLWVADGVPLGASKATPEVFRQQVGRSPDVKEAIEVAVVCNDPAMREEGVVGEVYGDREHVEVDVAVFEDLAREELRDVLEAPTDFLHYVGHVDRRGLQCRDGHLDARTLDSVGTEAFLLNGCRSYEQGRALVDGGAVAGLVTLDAVSNVAATRIGRKVAEVLRCGHSLGTAARLVSETSDVGFQYTIVGLGTAAVLDTRSGTPLVCEVAENFPDTVEIKLGGRPTHQICIGASFVPHYLVENKKFLNSGWLYSDTITRDDLRKFMEQGLAIVRFDGEIALNQDFLESEFD